MSRAEPRRTTLTHLMITKSWCIMVAYNLQEYDNMCGFGSSSVEAEETVVLPEAPTTPDTTSASSTSTADTQRRARASASGGVTSTVLTSSRGTSGKSLLGQ